MTAKNILIKGSTIINEGQRQQADLLIESGKIERIDKHIPSDQADTVIDGSGKLLMPGMIDDQVHFREPGLTHKGEIATESRAAVAGGVTSYMEMPNVNPTTTTHDALRAKLARASEVSAANYGFYFGGSNDNLEQVKSLPLDLACGVKVFMGSSTGNMLVDEPTVLKGIFSSTPLTVATHCEDTPTVNALEQQYSDQYGDEIPAHLHPLIRSENACYLSSSMAVELAREHGTRLHVLHITTEKELQLFESGPMFEKLITAEACVHHLWFSEQDYHRLGHLIKCNPAIKKASDRQALQRALLDDRIDIVATDHAPHTLKEKQNPYLRAPSGLPLVQHPLLTMLEFCHEGWLTEEQVAQKTAHNVAERFGVKDRGYIKEGFWADLVLVQPNTFQTVERQSLLYKCGWSPLEGVGFHHRIDMTIVSGSVAWDGSEIKQQVRGKALEYDRSRF
jgi:dihydroorotase